jgi:phospholipid transport system transporter-binding protein
MPNLDASANASVAVDGQGGCEISGVLDFETAVVVLNPVLEAIRASEALHIDFSGVSNSNSAGLALMVEWLGEARHLNHQLTFKSVPDSLQQLATVCQVDTLI